LDALVNRMDRSTLRLNESTRKSEGEGYKIGRSGGRGPIRCYNCDEHGNVIRYYPLPKIPWCSHYNDNTHPIEE